MHRQALLAPASDLEPGGASDRRLPKLQYAERLFRKLFYDDIKLLAENKVSWAQSVNQPPSQSVS